MFRYQNDGSRAIVIDLDTGQTWTFKDCEGIAKLVRDMNRKAITENILNDFRQALDWYQSIDIKSQLPPIVKIGEVF